jgi:hypothetical protein
MIKLIWMLLPVAVAAFLFWRTVAGRSTAMRRAMADFRRQLDYLVWIMLVCIAIGMVYSVVELTLPLWR